MSKSQAYFHQVGDSTGGQASQMFGSPCYKTMKKAFACFHSEAMVFKLDGEFHAEALSLDGTHLFDPSSKGRPMKQWVVLPYDYHKQWPYFAKAAKAYVDALNS